MDTPPATIPAQRLTRKEKTGGNGVLAIFLLLGGLALLLLFWPLGLLFILLAFLADSKHRSISICSGCGNEVAATSRLCPTCHATFTQALSMAADRAKRRFQLTIMALLILYVIALYFRR